MPQGSEWLRVSKLLVTKFVCPGSGGRNWCRRKESKMGITACKLKVLYVEFQMMAPTQVPPRFRLVYSKFFSIWSIKRHQKRCGI